MTSFSNIYCIVKQSGYSYNLATPSRTARFEKLSPQKKARLYQSHQNQSKFLEDLKQTATKLGLDIHYVAEQEMHSVSPGGNDLVFSCGGDGTFLTLAQIYHNVTLLGLNSDYDPDGYGSYGALTMINSTNLVKKLTRLANGDFVINEWSRLQAELNGKKLEKLAVNDIYFGTSVSYRTCEITVNVMDMEEEFHCSGLIACTGMGSHAWYYNAGGSPFNNDLDAFGFRILIPILKRPLKFTSGVISDRNEIIIHPNRDNYVLSFDSKSDVIQTALGDEIRISLSKDNPVRVVVFP